MGLLLVDWLKHEGTLSTPLPKFLPWDQNGLCIRLLRARSLFGHGRFSYNYLWAKHLRSPGASRVKVVR